MDELELLLDLYRGTPRQGPGDADETKRAIDLGRIHRDEPLKIADIGCGSGASTLVLAETLNAQITAVDFLQDFLDDLIARAAKNQVAERISARCASMDQLPFKDEEFDVIWAEGAIYNIGFERGVSEWRRFLKPGGLLAVSEITWLTDRRPAALEDHWNREYPEIATASEKLEVLERNGYTPIGYFVLPEACWTTHYYEPLQQRFDAFLERHGRGQEARGIVESAEREIRLYEEYKAYFSYGFYIAERNNESTR